MALVYADRVKESTTTTGTGTYSLGGAVGSFQSFAAIGNGNTCYYAATDGTDWEVGLGTYTSAGTTLARTTVLASSNAGAAVSWAAGTKTIWNDVPATAFVAFVGKLAKVVQQVFAASGTYTPTANMVSCLARAVGAGAGGGGAASASASNASSGGGGGGGEYAEDTFTAAQIGASKAVTIGAAGTGGAAGNNNGTAGGDTSLGVLLVAKGGSLGSGAAANTRSSVGFGGTGGTGAFRTPGGLGYNWLYNSVAGALLGVCPGGGNSMFGVGGYINPGAGGAVGTGYGAGGAPGTSWNASAATAGAAGTAGYMIITEFCSS